MDEPSATPEVMLAFYKRLYPFKSLFNWLNCDHTPSRFFTQREFAFTLENDVYLRYNSFKDADDLKKQIEKLNPSRFEIGAVYNARPKDKKSLRPGHLQPLKRELVFDIDMTDYDSIRTCCSGKGICRRCWGFIAAAVTVLDKTLRDDFGFNHVLWVYSGRRGIHCWVSDREAMDLTDDQRRSIMGYLEVVKGGKEQHKKVNVRGYSKDKDTMKHLHPSLKSSLTELGEGYFAGLILEDQDCFADEQGWTLFLELLPDKEVAENLRKQWSSKQSDSASKWEDFKRQIMNIPKESPRRVPLVEAMEDIILQYTYPRLDAEVSKHRNHLLKAPFCVHPATGRICVPVKPGEVARFDPEAVPTVGQLLRELDEQTMDGGDERADWERTSLRPYVEMLDAHVRGLMQETREAVLGGKNKLDW